MIVNNYTAAEFQTYPFDAPSFYSSDLDVRNQGVTCNIGRGTS